MHHIHVYNALKFTLINNITRLMIYRNMYIKRHLCNYMYIVLGEKMKYYLGLVYSRWETDTYIVHASLVRMTARSDTRRWQMSGSVI